MEDNYWTNVVSYNIDFSTFFFSSSMQCQTSLLLKINNLYCFSSPSLMNDEIVLSKLKQIIEIFILKTMNTN